MTKQDDEDGSLRTVATALLLAIITIAVFLFPAPPVESPDIEKAIVPHIVEHAEASERVEPVMVLPDVTTLEVVKAVELKYSEHGDLADQIIDCESDGRNVEIIDTNGKWSRGIAQFQDATWAWMSKEAGVVGLSTEPEKARQVLLWALDNGHGNHWTCHRIIMGQQ